MPEEKVMKPTNDLVFKALFGQDSSKEYLQSLLESVLSTTITNLSIVDPVIKIQDIADKSPILDIKVLTVENEYINIEIQVAKQKHFSNRSLYYWSRIYGAQLGEGEEYDKLKKAICINFLDFIHFQEQTEFLSTFTIQEKTQNYPLTDHLEIHFIELPKFRYDKDTVFNAGSPLYEWIYFMRYADKLSEEDVCHMSNPVRIAYTKLLNLSADETLRQKVITREIGAKDQEQRIKDAQNEARKEEALEVLRELLMEYHAIDLEPYMKKMQVIPIERIRTIRQSLRQEKSLVIQELDSL